MTKAEGRLFTIRNLDAQQQRVGKASPETVYEFEVFVEVPTLGEFRKGPFRLTSWDANQPEQGARRSLVLTIEDWLPSVPTTAATRAGFYHGVSVPGEFCALATAFFRRRVTLGPLVRMNEMPLRVPPQRRPPHDGLTSGELNLNDLDEWISRLSSLSGKLHQAFILACRMYQEAIELIDHKPDLSYLLLVSCIEVFVGKLELRTKVDQLAPEIRDALGKCEDSDARRILEKYCLDLDRGIKRNFVAFIVDHVTPDFWSGSATPAESKGRVTAEELPQLLGRIYDQRSLTVHEADPFPPNVLDPPDDGSEIDRRPEIIDGDRRWTQKQIIPYARFFERLVQHVLLTYLLRNTDSGDAARAARGRQSEQ